ARSPNEEAFPPSETGERAELRVAALDELVEERRGQARMRRVGACRRELRSGTRERALFQLVELGDAYEERRRRRVVDEVVDQPVGLPGIALGGKAPEA